MEERFLIGIKGVKWLGGMETKSTVDPAIWSYLQLMGLSDHSVQWKADVEWGNSKK